MTDVERYTRRRALMLGAGGVAALTAGSALLAACGDDGDDDSGGAATSAAAGATTAGGASSAASAATAKEQTAWWWGDADAPGMADWLKAAVEQFKADTGVEIKVAEQQTETLTSAFTAAAAAKQGPDIAAQWATQPVLSQAWGGSVVALDDYVPEEERNHWSYRQENLYGGKLWAAPMYIIGQPICYNKQLFEQAGLDPEAPPKTWDELMTAGNALKAKGITPIAIGNKDTYGGRWAFAFLAKQTLDSPDDLRPPLLGEASFGDEKYSQWMTMWKELIDAGFYNDDAMSLDSVGGGDVFKAGNAAMAWSTEGVAIGWGEALGEENVAPFTFPIYGTGKLAPAYTATQSTSYFITSWAKDPAGAAAFLQFLHTPAQQTSLYEHAKVVPADDRFDTSVITSPLRKQFAELSSTGLQIWLENWIPPQLDENANGPGGQKLMTGGSVKEVIDLWDQQAKAWREQNPDIAKKFSEWQMTPVSI